MYESEKLDFIVRKKMNVKYFVNISKYYMFK